VASVAEALAAAVLVRMQTPTPIVAGVDRVRRSHLTTVPRDKTPAVHVVEGDEVRKGRRNDCEDEWELPITLRIFGRSDEGFTATDDLKVAAVRRLDPASPDYSAYGSGVSIELPRIVKQQEIADADSIAVDIECIFRFSTIAWKPDESI
jgi:hypothetical protein